jgi:long-chain acyl-CoA synthetase
VFQRGGENIAPAAIESVINTHPAVMQCTVFGVPDTVLGEEVACIISIKPEFHPRDVTPQKIREFLRPKLARFQIPGWELRDASSDAMLIDRHFSNDRD